MSNAETVRSILMSAASLAKRADLESLPIAEELRKIDEQLEQLAEVDLEDEDGSGEP